MPQPDVVKHAGAESVNSAALVHRNGSMSAPIGTRSSSRWSASKGSEDQLTDTTFDALHDCLPRPQGLDDKTEHLRVAILGKRRAKIHRVQKLTQLQLVATYPDANPVQLLIGEDDHA